MQHRILFAPEAARDYEHLSARHRAAIENALETRLRRDPARTTGASLRKLRGLRKPRYRLRVHDVRVFYDVAPGEANVLALVDASSSAAWLDRAGEKA